MVAVSLVNDEFTNTSNERMYTKLKYVYKAGNDKFTPKKISYYRSKWNVHYRRASYLVQVARTHTKTENINTQNIRKG